MSDCQRVLNWAKTSMVIQHEGTRTRQTCGPQAVDSLDVPGIEIIQALYLCGIHKSYGLGMRLGMGLKLMSQKDLNLSLVLAWISRHLCTQRGRARSQRGSVARGGNLANLSRQGLDFPGVCGDNSGSLWVPPMAHPTVTLKKGSG